MKTIDIGKSGLLGSEISLGCMRLTELAQTEVDTLINTSLEVGIDFFDHADVGKNREKLFRSFFSA